MNEYIIIIKKILLEDYAKLFMRTEAEVKIYIETMIRPILAYTTETRAETKRIKQMIAGVTLWTKKPISLFENNIQEAVKRTKYRKREWNEQVERIEERSLAFVCKNSKLTCRRPPG